jgi:GT2 family glycosyltransferase
MEPPESTGDFPVVEPDDPGEPEPDRPFAAGEKAPPEALDEPVVLPDDDELADTEPVDVEVAPPVVAVVVTSGEGVWLTAALNSLAGQDYPALQVLVLDNAADADPTARIAAELPTAYVRRLDENRGFAAAVNEVLETVEGATFLLFCHDDVVLDTDAVRAMVEEAYRSNAAIVGPKLVDADNPDLLLEVGMTVDHYGVPFSTIEPGEIDQEQHDAVRDVFFVSHATMLVRTDLFRELGGFDPATAPGSDDIDLCWRARLAGGRVLVAPAARVRHRRATAVERRRTRRQSPGEARDATHARMRMLYKSYSRGALWWVLPTAFFLTLAEAVALVVTRRARQGGAVIAGWMPARNGRGNLRSARAATQALRRVDDAEVRDLMVRGSARLRTFLVQRLHAGDRLAYASSAARVRMARTRAQVRRTPAVLLSVVAVLLAFGSRLLFFERVPSIGGFQPWADIGSSWSTFTSAWRFTMVGAPVPATPVFALMSALQTVFLGQGGLARTAVVIGAVPLGAFGAYRLVRTLSDVLLPAAVAATAYAVNPVGRDAIGRGDIGPLVLFAVAPFIVLALVRERRDLATGDVEAAEPPDAAIGRGARLARLSKRLAGRRTVHAVLVVGILGAIAGCVWPPAMLFAPLVAVALALATLFDLRGWRVLRSAGLALLGLLVTLVLLSPWVWSLLGADPATLALRVRPPLTLADALRFDAGPARSGWYTLGLVVVALIPLVIATGARLVWATRAWMLALCSFVLAWLPGRISATAPVPSPSGVLVPAALGLAIAGGLGVSVLLDDMRRSHFGWRQVSAVAAVVGLALPLVALAVDSVSGRWQLPSTDWPTQVAWMQNQPTPGGFRVLWLGSPAALPVDAKTTDGISYGLTRDGAGDARALWAAPERDADRMLGRALAIARAGDTARLGHLLAPLGIRYVAAIARLAPGRGPRTPTDPALDDALRRQLDLSVSRIDDGGIIYSNDAWIPRRAIVPADTDVAAPDGAGLVAAARSNAGAEAEGISGPVSDSRPVGPGTVLWAEASDGDWQARASGSTLERSAAFDWTNAFELPQRASVGIEYRTSLLTRLLVVLNVVLWIVALVMWRRTRPPRRRDRGAVA